MLLPRVADRTQAAQRPSLATVGPTDLGLGAVAREASAVAAEMDETRRLEETVTRAEAEERAAPLLQEAVAAYEADFAERGAAWDGIDPGFARENDARFRHFFEPFAARQDLDEATQDALTRGVNDYRLSTGQRAVQYMTQRRGALAAQKAQAREAVDVGGRMVDYTVRFGEGRAELDRTYDGSQPDYAGSLLAIHDAAAAEVLAATPEHLKPGVEARLASQRVAVMGQAMDVEARGEGAYVAGTVKRGGEALVNSVIGAPQNYETALAQVDALVAGLPAAVRGEAKAGLIEDLTVAHLDGLIAEGRDEEVTAQLEGGAFDDRLSPARKARALEAARRAGEERGVDDWMAAISQDGAMADNVASIALTGVPVEGAPTVDQVAAMQGPQAAARYALQLRAAEDAAKNRPALGQMTEAQMGEWLEAQAPVPGSPGFAQAQETYAANQRLVQQEVERRKDPGAWALHQAPGLSDKLSAAIGGDRAAARDFVTGSLTLQGNAGIAAQNRRILPEGRAKAVVAQVEGGDPREGLLAIGSLIAAFGPAPGGDGAEARRGAAAQRMIVNELVAAGLDPDLAAAAVDLTGDETRMGAFIRARRGGGLKGLPEKEDRDAIGATVRRELAPFTASFAGGGTSAHLNAGRIQMAETIAADLVTRGRSPVEAAREASRIVDGNYAFVGPQGVRVPRQYGEGEAGRQLQRGMARTVETVLANDGALLSIPDVPEWRALTPAQRAERYTDAVSRNARWFATSDDRGAVLMLPERDGRWTPVLDAAGQPIARGWRTLTVAGRNASGPQGGRDPMNAAGSGSVPRGVRNNNPGNLRPTGERWQGQTGDDGGFMRFSTPLHGVRALAVDLTAKHGRGLRSVRQIISVYAPPSENDTDAYVRNVARALGVSPDAVLDFSGPQLEAMMAAIIQMENGQQPYPQAMLQEGARQARTRRR